MFPLSGAESTAGERGYHGVVMHEVETAWSAMMTNQKPIFILGFDKFTDP